MTTRHAGRQRPWTTARARARASNGTYAAGAQGVATAGELDGLEISISGVVHDDEAKSVTFSWSATVDDGDDADDERDAFFIDAVLVKF